MIDEEARTWIEEAQARTRISREDMRIIAAPDLDAALAYYAAWKEMGRERKARERVEREQELVERELELWHTYDRLVTESSRTGRGWRKALGRGWRAEKVSHAYGLAAAASAASWAARRDAERDAGGSAVSRRRGSAICEFCDTNRPFAELELYDTDGAPTYRCMVNCTP